MAKGAMSMFLHAACNDDVGIAGLDHLGSHVDTVQTGAADHVDGDSGVSMGRPAFRA